MFSYPAFLWLCVAVMAAVASTPVKADDFVFKGDSSTVRLQRQPCENEVILALIPAEIRNEFRRGVAVLRTRTIDLCWVSIGTDVTIIDVEGDGGKLPQAEFKREVGI